MANFTSSEVAASKVVFIDKKTASDGSHIGFNCKVIDGDGNHYSIMLTDIASNSDKASVKTELKSYLLTLRKAEVHTSSNSSELLSKDDASESLS